MQGQRVFFSEGGDEILEFRGGRLRVGIEKSERERGWGGGRSSQPAPSVIQWASNDAIAGLQNEKGSPEISLEWLTRNILNAEGLAHWRVQVRTHVIV